MFNVMDNKDLAAKTRLSLTVDERIKRAFESRAAAVGLSAGDLLAEIVETYYPDDLARADQLMREAGQPRKKR